MSKHGMYEDEFPDDGEAREVAPGRDRSHRRHRHRSKDRHSRVRAPRGEPMVSGEPGWDRSNWLFLLVLTNFVSLTIGTHIGHRHWDNIKAWMGQSEHESLQISGYMEPIVRP